MSRTGARTVIASIGILLLVILGSATANSNNIDAGALSEHSEAITANDLAPVACSSLPLVNVVTGAGTINGTGSNDLILGTSATDTINANAGNDCVVGGGGDDTIDGGDGSDVCLGGSGSNTLINCE